MTVVDRTAHHIPKHRRTTSRGPARRMMMLLAAAALPLSGSALPANGAPDLAADTALSTGALRTAPSTGPTVLRYVTASPGNVRSGPSTSYTVVGTIDQGVRIRGILRSDGWVDLPGDRFVSSVILSSNAPGGGTTPPPGGGTTPAPPGVSPSQSAVLQMAQRYTGVRYVYGGEDPTGFDCSGYTQYVFGRVGVSLPRTAAQQLAATTPTTNPRPGDLVFWGSWHVGIYAGDGYVYDAGRSTQQTQKRAIFPGVTSYGRVD